MDSYSTQNFDSCMMVSGNQQCNVSPSVNNQSQAGQVQTQEDDKQQQMEQSQIIQQNQSNTLHNKVLTPVRLPAILDGEYFTVTKLEDSNVTVRCSQCKRHLNGNLKSTGNFLSHIKRVHPFLAERIKSKSNQRKPATLFIDASLNEKPVETRGKRYKFEKAVDEEGVSNKEDSYEHPTIWNDTTFNSKSLRHTSEESPEVIDQLRVTAHNTIVMEDEYDAIGRNVAAKLRNMRLDQRIIAEKLLNDILFEAQLGNLSRDSNIHV
ncbi:uncharacterized protein LOC116847413 [Odontomachus brunneus]|uniref:uncharacterized protein LOC116847413 n=1 Tax=Odontomachus brunneus TaxID=486640 RepID=UPI0013F281E8|nr:uncharacterized protein LOC116847413 [Odontomachus brunneus]